MKKNTLTILFPLFFINIITAQRSNPGYLGKKNCLSYGTRQYISFFREFNNYIVDFNGELNYEIVTNRKASWQFAFGFNKSTIKDAYSYDFFGSIILKSPLDNKYYHSYISTADLDFRVTHFNVSRVFYLNRKGAIAPLGMSFKLGLNYDLINVIRDNNTYNYSNYNSGIYTNYSYKNNQKAKNNKRLTSLNMEFGSKRFFNDKIFYRKSIAYNLPLDFYINNKIDLMDANDFNVYSTHIQYRSVQSLTISLGIGVAF